MRKQILILGGTSEARQLASELAVRTDLAITLSLAGRTHAPLTQGVPTRSGGFGGVPGLVAYLREHHVRALIDATHPYAATMSAHARDAAQLTGTPTATLGRLPWTAVLGDRWIEVADAQAAVAYLGSAPRRVFLTIGRQAIADFSRAPQHDYLIRSVDPVVPPLAVPRAEYILQRGPFGEDEERELLRSRAIEVLVAKNSGGTATYAKIVAARSLGITVLMLGRPSELPHAGLTRISAVVAWLDHVLDSPIERGV
jgi:precorrin-6A/cobalt-precorrin-6A reductase